MFSYGERAQQVAKYAQELGTPRAIVTNGKRILGVDFANGYDNHEDVVDIDLLEYLTRLEGDIEQDEMFPKDIELELKALYLRYAKENFAETESFIRQIGLPLDEWALQARPIEEVRNDFINDLGALVDELQIDASAQIRRHLRKTEEFKSRAAATFSASALSSRRPRRTSFQHERLEMAIKTVIKVTELIEDLPVNPSAEQAAEFEIELTDVAANPASITGEDWVQRPFTQYSGLTWQHTPEPLRKELKSFVTACKQSYLWEMEIWPAYEKHVQASEKLNQWWALLGDTLKMDSFDKAVEEFALQASYITIIRLLMVRICEDKEVFITRTLSDGGFKEIHDALRRYLEFSKALGFEELLSVAFKNAQSVYAHFFGGRRLFDWYTADDQRMVKVVYQLNRYNFSGVREDILGTVYERYAKKHGAEREGRYYTTPPVSKYMCRLAGLDEPQELVGKSVIDPACGSGTFLVAAARTMIEAYSTSSFTLTAKEKIERVVSSIWGFDINPFACYLTETNLLIQLLDTMKQAYQEGEFNGINAFHVYQTDSLIKTGVSRSLSVAGEGLEEDFSIAEAIKTRTYLEEDLDFTNGFDVVITNPPYGSASRHLADEYPAATDNNDLYAGFIDLCGYLADSSGTVVMIVPSQWLSQPMFKTLRQRFFYTFTPANITGLPKDIFERAFVDCVVFAAKKNEDTGRRAPEAEVEVVAMLKKQSIDDLASASTETINSGQWYSEPDLRIMLDRKILDLRAHFRAIPHDKVGDHWEIKRGTLPPPEMLEAVPGGTNPEDYVRYLFTGNDHNLYRYYIDKGEMGFAVRQDLREVPPMKFFQTVPRVLVRRIVSRSWRIQAAVEESESYWNKKDIYCLIGGDEQSTKFLCAYLNSKLPSYYVVKSSQAAQKDDMTQLIYDDIIELPIPPVEGSLKESVLDAYEIVHRGVLESWQMQKDGIRHKHYSGMRILDELNINPVSELVFDRLQLTDLATAASRGLLEINGNADANCTKVQRDDRNIVLRGGTSRPDLWLEAASQEMAELLEWYLGDRISILKTSPFRSLLGQLRIPRDANQVHSALDKRNAIIDEKKQVFREIWNAEDTLDELFMDALSVPDSIRDAIREFPGNI